MNDLVYRASAFVAEVIPFFRNVPSLEYNLYPQVGFLLAKELPCTTTSSTRFVPVLAAFSVAFVVAFKAALAAMRSYHHYD